MGASRRGEKAGGLAELFDHHRDHRGMRIVNQPFDEILDAGRRLVAGGDGIGQRQPAAEQDGVEDGGDRARLRDDADRGALRGGCGRRLDEGERDAIDEVDEAEAVRPFHHHAGGSGDARDLALFGEAFLATLGESCGEDHDAADATFAQRANRVDHACARDRQHGGVDAVRQVGDRTQARPVADRVAIGVDEMDVARIAEPVEVAEQRRTQRAGLFGGADDGDRARTQQPVERFGYGHGGFRPSASTGRRHQGPACTISRR